VLGKTPHPLSSACLHHQRLHNHALHHAAPVARHDAPPRLLRHRHGLNGLGNRANLVDLHANSHATACSARAPI
jgi:hypothetical protein